MTLAASLLLDSSRLFWLVAWSVVHSDTGVQHLHFQALVLLEIGLFDALVDAIGFLFAMLGDGR